MSDRPGARRRAREFALALLLSADVGELGPAKVFESAEDSLVAMAEDWDLSDSVVCCFPGRAWVRQPDCKCYGDIDATIADLSEDWALDRMAAIDRNILRMAITELLYFTDVPVSAAINEAVELAKLYGTPDSGRFVNGMLGALARRRGLVETR